MSSLRESPELSIPEQAVQWLCELGDESQDRRAEFAAWLRESPRHVEEFLLTTTVWKAFDDSGPQRADRIAEMIAEALTQGSPSNVIAIATSTSPTAGSEIAAHTRRTYSKRWIASVAAAVIVLALGWLLAPRLSLFGGRSYATGIGEQRAFRLPDSSIVYLNAQSRVEIRFSAQARELHLSAGEALFTVSPERDRPFRVNAGNSVIQALGTQFNVYRHAAVTTVSVLEGAVQILANGADVVASAEPARALEPRSNRLNAGEQASITPSGKIVRPEKRDIADAVAWRDRRVVFRAERLEDIAAEFSRYSPRRIRIEGDLARNKRLTASFAADDPESFVLFLEKERELAVEADGDGFVVRGR